MLTVGAKSTRATLRGKNAMPRSGRDEEFTEFFQEKEFAGGKTPRRLVLS